MVVCFRLCAANLALIFFSYFNYFSSVCHSFGILKCRDKKKGINSVSGRYVILPFIDCCREVTSMQTLKTGCYREVVIVER